jgi:hypothetical protein
MPTLTLELPSAGQKILAGLHATNYADIQALLNGNLDGSNINQASVFALGGLGITLGADVNLYRSAANILKTDDQLFVGGGLISLGTAVTSAAQSPSIHSDGTNVYHGLNNGVFFFRPMGASFNGGMLRLLGGATGAELTFFSEDGTGDVNLYRAAANTLKSDDNLHLAGGLWLDTDGGGDSLIFGSAADIALYRVGAGILGVNGQMYLEGATPYLVIRPTGSANAKFYAGPAGNLAWGDGTTTQDTNLYRAATNELKTDGTFTAVGTIVASLGTANKQVVLGDIGAGGGLAFLGPVSYDTWFYRAGVDTLKASGNLRVDDYLVVDDSNTGAPLYFGSAGDTAMARTAANEVSMAAGDTFKVSDAGLKFSDNSVQVSAAAFRSLAYAENTGNTSITATSEATANNILSAGAVTFDGSSAYVIRFRAALARSANSTSMQYFLYDGSSSIGIIGQTDTDASGNGHPIYFERRLVPSAGSHTYSIRAKVSSGTGTVFGGPGGSGNIMPVSIEVLKVS